MFAGNAGLASDGQAALELGNWDYVGFEKDTSVWESACEVIANHMTNLDRREKEMRSRIRTNLKLLPLLRKINQYGLSSLDENEVLLPCEFSYFG